MFKIYFKTNIFLLTSECCSLPELSVSLQRGWAVLMLHTCPEKGGERKVSAFFPSDCAKVDETGDGYYKSVLSQCSPKTKALKYSVIIVSLKEEIL